jgi:RNA polymerase sigma-70 factor (ECF subfamily)
LQTLLPDRRRACPDPGRAGAPAPDPLRAHGGHHRRPRHRPRWEATDWQQITDLYDALIQIWPSPVVALNRAIAIGEARGPRAGLAALDELATEPQLAGYHYLPAARAEFLRRLHRTDDARLAYQEARMLADNPVEQDFLTRRISELDA